MFAYFLDHVAKFTFQGMVADSTFPLEHANLLSMDTSPNMSPNRQTSMGQMRSSSANHPCGWTPQFGILNKSFRHLGTEFCAANMPSTSVDLGSGEGLLVPAVTLCWF